MPPVIGMLITGVLPVIVIGAILATLFAIKQQRTRAAVAWSIAALVAFGSCVWVYVAVFDRVRISQPAACAPRADWGFAGSVRRGGDGGQEMPTGRTGRRGSVEESLESMPTVVARTPSIARSRMTTNNSIPAISSSFLGIVD